MSTSFVESSTFNFSKVSGTSGTLSGLFGSGATRVRRAMLVSLSMSSTVDLTTYVSPCVIPYESDVIVSLGSNTAGILYYRRNYSVCRFRGILHVAATGAYLSGTIDVSDINVTESLSRSTTEVVSLMVGLTEPTVKQILGGGSFVCTGKVYYYGQS